MTKVEFLEEVARSYQALFPERYEAYRRLAAEERSRLIKPGAFSAGGTMQFRMVIPTELFLFIRRYWPDFGDSPADIDLLQQVWTELSVSRQ